MSLRQLLLFLLVRAGFHRWSPAMQGRRNAAVLCKYLMAAAANLVVAGAPLAQRLVVVQPWGLSGLPTEVLAGPGGVGKRIPRLDGVGARVLVIGEVMRCDALEGGCMLWLNHLASTPLRLEPAVWQSLPAELWPLLLAVGRQASNSVRLLVAALVRLGPDPLWKVDVVAMVPLTTTWIPVAGIQVLPLVDALVARQRRFAVVLPIDNERADGMPAVWLLDAGPRALPLRLATAAQAQGAQSDVGGGVAIAPARPCWTWFADRPMPTLPPRR